MKSANVTRRKYEDKTYGLIGEMEGIGSVSAVLSGMLQVKCLADGKVEGGNRIDSKKSHGEI